MQKYFLIFFCVCFFVLTAAPLMLHSQDHVVIPVPLFCAMPALRDFLIYLFPFRFSFLSWRVDFFNAVWIFQIEALYCYLIC